MSPRRIESWEDVGRRVAEARHLGDRTQQQLADELGLDRTAIAKIESGQRRLDALELGQLARLLDRTPEWFVTHPPPAVVSRRAERAEATDFPRADDLIERLARDVELLFELECLRPIQPPPIRFENLEEAEGAAARVRRDISQTDGPLVELQMWCEKLGLYAFSFLLDEEALDGTYVALEQGGVALINGAMDPGRRRFNLAHELGHHLLADEYSTDVGIAEGRDARERLINAFAINLLMPGDTIRQRWANLHGPEEPRQAILRMSIEFRVSWTAACAHARNLRLIPSEDFERLIASRPTRGEHLEVGIPMVDELLPPALPPSYVVAVVRAFRRNKINADRAVELLHETLSTEELPPADVVPLDAFRSEMEHLG